MPRFTPSKYNPFEDSDTGSVMNLREMSAIQRDLKCVVLGVEPGDCPCGCGQKPKGKKAEYAMGHDARYRGKLIRAFLTGTDVAIVAGGKTTRRTARGLAQEAGKSFVEALDAAEARREQANARLVQKAKGSKRTVKVGRWEYTGQVAAVYTTPEGDEYEIEYVTKQGETKKVRVPASQTKEA
jgi:hypothetical protein